MIVRGLPGHPLLAGKLWLGVMPMESHLEPALQRLDELAQLEPNWNSYGAAAMSPRAITIAREFLKSVAKRLDDKVGEGRTILWVDEAGF